MGNNRFMVVSEENGIIAMNPSYKQLELEYETKEEARDSFTDIKVAYESGRIDVYI